MHPKTVKTTPYLDQKPGTSGLRKPTEVFLTKPNYTENFIQSIVSCVAESEKTFEGKTLIVGGDGRFYLKEAIDIIIQIAVANSITHIQIGKSGILSTPAVSSLIRDNNSKGKYTMGGIILTASHNPGGEDGDFGIKFNTPNGGPAPDVVTNKIFEISKTLTEFKTLDEKIVVNIDQTGEYKVHIESVGNILIEVIDPVEKYLELMKSIFDFELIKNFLKEFPIVVNCLSGVTGPYVERIFGDELGLNSSTTSKLMKTTPLPDFGGLHPDPNLTYAADLVKTLETDSSYEFGVAYDGDGDRNMLLGKNGFFVNPSDSLAVLAANIECIGYFKKTGVKGFARSMPTSCAIDRVGEKLGIKVYEVPTGWKYFGNLMDAGLLSLCGEESFGTGSDHIREKDGIWASLAWLQILATKKTSVQNILETHWSQYGRNYFSRLDYENLDSQLAEKMMLQVEEKVMKWSHDDFMSEVVKSVVPNDAPIVSYRDNFEYVDPVDGSKAVKQGFRVIFEDGSRIVLRLSGTGSSGATLRTYVEKFEKNVVDQNASDMLSQLISIAGEISCVKQTFGLDGPTVTT